MPADPSSPPAGGSWRFRGQIAGVGSTSGIRVVVGWWRESPFGEFADAMIERADGTRILLAPTEHVRDLVATTYTFDETRIEPLSAREDAQGRWLVESPSLSLTLTPGARLPVGWLLRAVPRRLATSPAWCGLIDPVARVVMRGVRTRGIAREGRRESYGATDSRAVEALTGEFDGHALGTLADVDPPCRFGFSSTPRRPSMSDVTTTIEFLT